MIKNNSTNFIPFPRILFKSLSIGYNDIRSKPIHGNRSFQPSVQIFKGSLRNN